MSQQGDIPGLGAAVGVMMLGFIVIVVIGMVVYGSSNNPDPFGAIMGNHGDFSLADCGSEGILVGVNAQDPHKYVKAL